MWLPQTDTNTHSRKSQKDGLNIKIMQNSWKILCTKNLYWIQWTWTGIKDLTEAYSIQAAGQWHGKIGVDKL